MSLRRLLPALRVDYIRVSGNRWVEDPDKRFEATIDMRGPLILLVNRALNAIKDDLPKGFKLRKGICKQTLLLSYLMTHFVRHWSMLLSIVLSDLINLFRLSGILIVWKSSILASL